MRRREQIFPLDISKLEDVLGKILANVQGVRGGNLFPPYPIPTHINVCLFQKKIPSASPYQTVVISKSIIFSFPTPQILEERRVTFFFHIRHLILVDTYLVLIKNAS